MQHTALLGSVWRRPRNEPLVEVGRAVLICTAIRPLPQRHVLRAFAQGCRAPSHYTPSGCGSAACAFLLGSRPCAVRLQQQSSGRGVSEALVIRLRGVLWWARIMSCLRRRSRRRIADARLRKGLANVAGSQACPFVPVGIPVRAMSPAIATRTAVGLPALTILQLIGDVFILWQLGHAILPSQKSGAAPQDD